MDRKEAIKIVRGLYEKSLFLKKDKEAIETLIPEIKDDEDERIRKEMIEYFSQYKEDGLRGVDITPWIAYLERQKEQKPAGWSKEDTDILWDAITAVDLLGNGDEYSKTHPNLAKAFRVAKDWLKSLPERFK